MSETAAAGEDTLELALRRRLTEIVAGAAATEGELRRLAGQGYALVRGLEEAIEASEARLDRLVVAPGALVAEMASELRRRESLRAERDGLQPLLLGLEQRARQLRDGWLKPG